MGADEANQSPRADEDVRCLECGFVYAKPVTGGAVERNPGCPECGYVGWIPFSAETEPRWQRHSGADRPLRLVDPRR
jgi:hypothetical protein